MKIFVNGQAQLFEMSISIFELLETRETDPSTVVIELNKNIIKSCDYQQTLLMNKDQVEILRFVGGG